MPPRSPLIRPEKVVEAFASLKPGAYHLIIDDQPASSQIAPEGGCYFNVTESVRLTIWPQGDGLLSPPENLPKM